MEYKTDIWMRFVYGGWSIIFKKEFILPFAPFYGLSLNDGLNDIENRIELSNTDYRTIMIDYNINEYRFDIDVINSWRGGVRDDVVDDTIDTFTKTGWTRMDNKNTESLKELMNKNNK
jgi:hypothetical protein